MRLDRPIGIWLLLLPSLWGIALASGGLAQITAGTLYIIFLFTIGAVIMRGAGCVINDLWDRDIDKLVERTQTRPIASGQISVKHAVMFLAGLLLCGLAILLQFNLITIIMGFITIPLIISYPLMKRVTWWPQAFLGLTFNFGALMGWSAIAGGLGTPAILLYLGAILWTIGYDTIYAHQDKDDDALIGVKSTALKFKDNGKRWVSIFYLVSFILAAGAVFIGNNVSLLSGIALIGLAVHFTGQIMTWTPDNHESSLRVFKSNRNAGLLILLACL